MFKFVKNIFSLIFLFIAILLFFIILRTSYIWEGIYFEQIIIAMENGTTGVGEDIIKSYIYYAFIPALIITFLLAIFINRNIYLVIFSTVLCIFSLYKINFFEYLIYQTTYSEIYKTEYINPDDIKFKFPEKKQNLVILYLESIEKDYANPTLVHENLLPYLSELADKETSFDGFAQLPTQDYTIAALVSGFCGVPYKYKRIDGFTGIKNFLPSLVCYTDILKREGYKNYLLKATDLRFARTGSFFENHGFDYVKGILDFEPEFGIKLEENQGTSWGYRDSSYYEVAKKKLLSIASEKQPFVLTLVTLDTHAPDIYLDENCTQSDNYTKDVIKCADKMTKDFVDWFKKQDFYKNTTLIILGDHTATGKNKLYPNHENRQIVNIILNSKMSKPHNLNRNYTTIDIAPTILNALGVEFEDGKFGLGRSLYSDKPTLYEKMGKKLFPELLKSAHEYNLFNKIINTVDYKYEPYSKYGVLIDTNEDIKKYTYFSELYFNNLWIDTLLFSLPDKPNKDIALDINFKVLFMEKNKRIVEIFANDVLVKTLEYGNTVKQPLSEKIIINKDLIKNDKKLKIEFKGKYVGYTPISIGIGLLNFKIEEVLN